FAVKIGCTSAAKLTGAGVSAATTSATNVSTVASIAFGSDVFGSPGSQPPFDSAFMKAAPNFVSAALVHPGSTAAPWPAAFASHASLLPAFFPVAASFAAAQERPSSVLPSGSAATTSATNRLLMSAIVFGSAAPGQPPFASAFPNAVVNLSSAL